MPWEVGAGGARDPEQQLEEDSAEAASCGAAGRATGQGTWRRLQTLEKGEMGLSPGAPGRSQARTPWFQPSKTQVRCVPSAPAQMLRCSRTVRTSEPLIYVDTWTSPHAACQVKAAGMWRLLPDAVETAMLWDQKQPGSGQGLGVADHKG